MSNPAVQGTLRDKAAQRPLPSTLGLTMQPLPLPAQPNAAER